jgi:hypothetical protein
MSGTGAKASKVAILSMLVQSKKLAERIGNHDELNTLAVTRARSPARGVHDAPDDVRRDGIVGE